MEANAYELARAARIEENKARMKSVISSARALEFAATKSDKSMGAKRNRARIVVHDGASNAMPRRVSRRARGEAPLGVGDAGVDGADAHAFEVTHAPETYDDAHVAALGSCEEPWTLFVDGCDERGRRVYDVANAKCCHQCRQKTKGMRTSCARCGMMRGVYCGDCLMMRHGENILEANAKGAEWKCPCCRDICNCSFCRTRKGWAPTGSMYREALAAGFDSVAHYLVLSNQTNAEKREAAMREAAEKAKAYAAKRAEEESSGRGGQGKKRPHWLEEKVYAE